MYHLPVKLDSLERRKKTGWLLHLLCGFFLVISSAPLFRMGQLWPAVSICVVAVLSIAYGFAARKGMHRAGWNTALRLFQVTAFASLLLLFQHTAQTVQLVSLFFWMALIAVTGLSERKLYANDGLLLRNDGIILPGYFNMQVMPWSLVKEIVLRADYLTIFRSNDTYVQLEMAKLLPPVERERINEFCRGQIAAAATENVSI